MTAGAGLLGGVLAGGASRRMGRPKHAIVYNGRTLLDQTVALLGAVCSHVWCVGSPPVSARPTDADSSACVGLIADATTGSGPPAAILGALRHEPSAAWLIAACDMPLLHADALRWLIAQRAPGRLAILPRVRAEGVEPLLALYEPAALPLVHQIALRGGRLQELAAEPGAYVVPVPEPLRRCWTNINTPDELAALVHARPSG